MAGPRDDDLDIYVRFGRVEIFRHGEMRAAVPEETARDNPLTLGTILAAVLRERPVPAPGDPYRGA